jgi:hypothetical protein
VSEYWFYSERRGRVGPVTREELSAILKNNKGEDLRVWREGLDGWKTAIDVPELAPKTRGKGWLRRTFFGAGIGALLGLARSSLDGLYLGAETLPGLVAYYVAYCVPWALIGALVGFIFGAVRPKAKPSEKHLRQRGEEDAGEKRIPERPEKHPLHRTRHSGLR